MVSPYKLTFMIVTDYFSHNVLPPQVSLLAFNVFDDMCHVF